MHRDDLDQTDWTPERKIVGAAIAALIIGAIEAFTDVPIPTSVATALPVVVGYFIPNKRS